MLCNVYVVLNIYFWYWYLILIITLPAFIYIWKTHTLYQYLPSAFNYTIHVSLNFCSAPRKKYKCQNYIKFPPQKEILSYEGILFVLVACIANLADVLFMSFGQSSKRFLFNFCPRYFICLSILAFGQLLRKRHVYKLYNKY